MAFLDSFDTLEKLGFEAAYKKENRDTIGPTNARIEQDNARKVAANDALPADQRKPESELGLEPLVPEWTLESYALTRCKGAARSYATQHVAAIGAEQADKVLALPAAQQTAILNQVGLGALAAIQDPQEKAYWVKKGVADAMLGMAYAEDPAKRIALNALAANLNPDLA